MPVKKIMLKGVGYNHYASETVCREALRLMYCNIISKILDIVKSTIRCTIECIYRYPHTLMRCEVFYYGQVPDFYLQRKCWALTRHEKNGLFPPVGISQAFIGVCHGEKIVDRQDWFGFITCNVVLLQYPWNIHCFVNVN